MASIFDKARQLALQLKGNAQRMASPPVRSPVPRYNTQPTYNKTVNNVQRAILRPAARVQNYLEQDRTPRIDLSPRIQRNPVGSVGQSVIDSTVNIPSNLMRAGVQTGKDIRTGAIRDPRVAISNVARVASPLVDIATLGTTGTVAKQGLKLGTRKIAPQAVLEGLKYGGVYGGLSGLQEGRNAPSVQAQLKMGAEQAGSGAVTGAAVAGLFLGAVKGAHGAKNKLMGTVAQKVKELNPNLSDEQARKIAGGFVRDELGRFTKGAKKQVNTFYKSDIPDDARIALRKSLGLPETGDYRAGFAQLDAEIGGKKIDPILDKKNKLLAEIKATEKLPDMTESGKFNTEKKAKLMKLKQSLISTEIAEKEQSKNFTPIGDTLKNRYGIGQSPGGIDDSPPVNNPKDPFFNVNRMGVDNKTKQFVKDAIQKEKGQVEKVVGKKLTHEEVINKAKSISNKLDKTIGRNETLELGAKALNLRNKLAEVSQKGQVDDEFIQLLIQDKAFGTNIARLLEQRKIVSDPSEGTLVNKLIENVLKNNKNTDEILKAAKGVDFNDSVQSAEFYRKYVNPTVEDWLDTLRYNSMLSSPNTHINNSVSNFQGTGIIAPIEKTIAGGIDFLSSTITGKDRKQFAGEGVEYAKGYWSNLHNAAIKFSKVLTGDVMSTAKEVYDIPLATKGALAGVEKVLKIPARLLQATDEFFQTLTEAGSKQALDYRASKGVNVDGIEKKAFYEGRKRLFNAEFDLNDEGYILKALEFIPQGVLEARQSSNPVVRTIAKFTLPFIKVPANILKQSVEYSPLGLTTLPGAKNKNEQLAKAIMGTSVGLSTAMLVASDRMTWAEPTDPTKKEAYKAAGMQAYSVKVGDSWVSYSKLHPAISFNLALVAAVRDAQQNQRLTESELETVMNGVAKWANFYADQSYVKNIGEMVAATKGDAESITRFMSNYPQQLIPFRALMGWVTRIIDPYQRKVDQDGSVLDKQLQQLATQIPLLSEKVPTRKGPDGAPIPNNNRILNAFSPVRTTKENPGMKQYYDSLQDKSKSTKMKNDIIEIYKSGDVDRAKKLKEENNVSIKKTELKNAIVKDVAELYFQGDIEGAKALKEKLGISVTKKDLREAAKKKAIVLYLSGDIEGAKELKRQFGFSIKKSEIANNSN